MNVWILFNKDAGGGISVADLHESVQRAGHCVLDIVSTDAPERRFDSRSELVVAAGGDGTVAEAARDIAGSGVPLAILPLGTANNIATSLGLADSSIPDLIARWDAARRVPFDMGHVRADSKEWLMVEGAGTGLVPLGIAAAEQAQRHRDDTGTPDEEVASALHLFHRVLQRLEPFRSTIVIDGRSVTSDFLLVEVLNIRSVGPNLVLSPSATPSDGYFDVVMAEPAHRDRLLTYLELRQKGHQPELCLPNRRATTVRIEGCDQLHIDDEHIGPCRRSEISIAIDPGAVTVLV